MDSKEQIVVSLKNENDFLKIENEFLKREFIRLTGSYPNIDQMGNVSNLYLPPINNNNQQSDSKDLEQQVDKLKEENEQLKRMREIAERQTTNLVNENSIIAAKLNNLENVFIGSNIVRNRDGTVVNDMGGDYNTAAVNPF